MGRKKAVQRSRGQLIQRGPNKWLIRVYLGKDASGKRLYENETFEGTQTDARVRMGVIQANRDTNNFVKPNDHTVATFWPLFIAEKRSLAQNTRGQYEDRFRLDIAPQLGAIKLRDLEATAVSRWVTWMTDVREHSPRTVRYSYSLLFSMYEQALAWSLVARNPVSAELPAKEHEEMKVFTPAETVAFLDAAEEDPLRALWYVLLTAGLRPQEALALTWADLDGKRLTISKALIRVKLVNKETGKAKLAWKVGPTKTKRGRRTFTLPSEAVGALRDHQIKTGGIGTALIFKAESGAFLDIANVRKAWVRACKRAKVPVIRLYDARHTNATTLLQAGENLKVVSERLGHASIQITADVYAHVLPEMDEGAADSFTAALNKARQA
jgi:integrase